MHLQIPKNIYKPRIHKAFTTIFYYLRRPFTSKAGCLINADCLINEKGSFENKTHRELALLRALQQINPKKNQTHLYPIFREIYRYNFVETENLMEISFNCHAESLDLFYVVPHFENIFIFSLRLEKNEQ